MKKKLLSIFLAVLMSLSLAVPAFAFNANDAITYANRYADIANSNYNHYSADCTNYVSQALYAGGLAHDTTWYSNIDWHGNNYVRTDSVAWKNANALKDYIKGKSGVTKIGQWSKYAMTSPFTTNAYVNNSSNFTNSNVGRVIIFYDWNADNKMDHAAFYVKNNSASRYSTYNSSVQEGTGDLINQHSNNRKQVLWRPDYRQLSDPNQVDEVTTTRVHAFQIPA